MLFSVFDLNVFLMRTLCSTQNVEIGQLGKIVSTQKIEACGTLKRQKSYTDNSRKPTLCGLAEFVSAND